MEKLGMSLHNCLGFLSIVLRALRLDLHIDTETGIKPGVILYSTTLIEALTKICSIDSRL
jgi:hypothetical protein